MSTEQNKALLRRWFSEFISKNDTSLADELIDPAYINHFLGSSVSGPAAERQIMALFFSAFPDLQGSLEDTVAEGDKVATRIIWRGHNTGSLMGMPPTGKYAEISSNNIFRIANGKIVENWPQVDMAGLMQQLGVGAPAGQA